MFGLTTLRRLRQETDALRAQVAGLRAQRDTVIKERNAFKAAAKAASANFIAADIERQTLANAARSNAAALGTELVEGGRTGADPDLVTRAARERDRARVLEKRLAELQAVNERCTCGGGA